MKFTRPRTPVKLNRPVMPPGHDCGVRGTPRLFNGVQARRPLLMGPGLRRDTEGEL